ncbi:TlpA family protein disulfide reductase [Paludisphaera rhizosphaerae]|uniref:TlpA family protein disulfide reductase n=1 Tax=Paludisphaera rhizosphaerae TaxID=2711216 RepID=UPI0013EDE277|nr:redoxin family protein [Paludisphaera rhizosphaerae]
MRKLVATTALALTAGLASLAAPAARADSLGVGDAAPKLEVKEFVKGEPIKALEPGSVYVVEFWATWCGPCRATIPHLTELQKKHGDVKFVGVSIWEQDPSAVKPFVKEMGEKMDYRVAMDAVPKNGDKDGDPDDGAMAKNWMKAAELQGIPTAFIVGKDLKILWIGHPAALEEPLAQVVEGKWDVEKAIADARKEKEEVAKLAKFMPKLQKAMESDEPRQILQVIDEMVKEVPAAEERLRGLKFTTLVHAGEFEKALALAKTILEGKAGENAQTLSLIAWTIVDPELKSKPDAKLIAFALEAAKKADELEKQKSAPIADTLAKAYFDSGEPAKALETQKRAINLAKGTEMEDDGSLKERLEQYQKAVEGKKKD